MGRVVRVKTISAGMRLLIDFGDWMYQPRAGESICVSGVCLTYAPSTGGDEGANLLGFDVIYETLDKTTLGTLEPASPVNLESSLTPSTPMGGHFVQGHIDGVGTITNVQKGEDWRITVRPPTVLMDYIIPKGSVAIDGVSMTFATVGDDTFELAAHSHNIKNHHAWAGRSRHASELGNRHG